MIGGMRETVISLLNLTATHDRIMPAGLTLENIVNLFSRNVEKLHIFNDWLVTTQC